MSAYTEVFLTLPYAGGSRVMRAGRATLAVLPPPLALLATPPQGST